MLSVQQLRTPWGRRGPNPPKPILEIRHLLTEIETAAGPETGHASDLRVADASLASIILWLF